MKANGSGNGRDPDDNDQKIIKFPSLAERDKMRREQREEEERWRKQYRQRNKSKRDNTPTKWIKGLLVIIAASLIWLLIEYSGIKLGGFPAAIFILATCYIFAKATGLEERMGWGWTQSKKINLTPNSTQEPFFKAGNIPPFSRALIASFWIVHLPLYLLVAAPQRYDIFQTFGFVPANYTGAEPWHWEALITPLTYAFIHGSWMHLIFNTVMGLVMAMFFEKIFGAKATAKFFTLCVLGGAALYFLLSPFSSFPVIGASGGISGLFAALLYVTLTQNAMSPLTRRFGKYGPWPMLGFWALFISIPGILMGENVAWQAHLGGYLTGIALLLAMQKGKIRL